MARKRAGSSGVGTCPFGGKAAILLGLMVLPVLHNSCRVKGTTPTVFGVIFAMPTMLIVFN